MGTSVDRNSSKSVIRMLQHSILQLCNEHVGYSNRLQILGVLCMTIDEEPHELVVKVNNTLKRVGQNTPSKDGTPQAAQPAQPMIGPFCPTIPISPIPSLNLVQNLTKQFQNPGSGKKKGPGNSGASQVTGVPFKVSADSLIAQSAVTPVSVPEFVGAIEENSAEGELSTAEKKSQGRKGRKPTKVHHVYDEGELILNGDDINDADVLTVMPTDPDHPEEEMEPIEITPETPGTSGVRNQPTTSAASSQASIMRQVLEQGAAAAMEASLQKQSPYRNHPYAGKGAASPGKQARSASIKALLQAQAQKRMTESKHIINSFNSNSAMNFDSVNAVNAPAESSLSMTLPLTIAPVSPDQNSSLNDTCDSVTGADGEQEEALDFSSADKTLNDTGDTRLVIDETPSNSNVISVTADTNGKPCFSIKNEPLNDNDESSQSHFSESDNLSTSLQNGTQLTSTPVNYHTPYLNHTFMEGMTGMLHPAYAGLNLSLSSGYLTNGSMSSDRSLLSVQYTSSGPITVGANGHNVSNSPRVKDIIMYNEQSPLKQQKGNKVVQEGDFMLDKLGLDPKRRRRRSPDETLTADEIAEYMGATALANNTGPNSIKFKCKYCPEEMDDLVRYLQHTLTVHSGYICHQCGKSFTTKSSLLRHRPIHTGLRRFACSICKKTFYRKDKCKSHIKRHLGPGDQNVDQFQQIEPVPELPE